jgi:homoserine O-succinyltransferase/O-acetyltransferase
MDKTLRLCLVDMNNGHANQANRCFRILAESFFRAVRQQNPEVKTELVVVEPRNTRKLPPTNCDLYLSTGGPDSPYDHDGEPWLDELFGFYDQIVERNVRGDADAPSLFGVCYTFELLVRHFRVCAMVPRASRKFGVMPAYMTAAGEAHPLLEGFGDRLFAFEHRTWEAIDPDEARIAQLGGSILARESRDGVSKGKALLAFDLAPGIECTQFHPEADRQGVIVWVSKREQAQAFVDTYGLVTYDRMLRTLDNPERIAKTFSLMIPGWLSRKFNALAVARGWRPIETPRLDMDLFEGTAPSAASVRFDSLVPTMMEPSLNELDDEPRAADLELDLVSVRKSTIAQNVARLAQFGSD